MNAYEAITAYSEVRDALEAEKRRAKERARLEEQLRERKDALRELCASADAYAGRLIEVHRAELTKAAIHRYDPGNYLTAGEQADLRRTLVQLDCDAYDKGLKYCPALHPHIIFRDRKGKMASLPYKHAAETVLINTLPASILYIAERVANQPAVTAIATIGVGLFGVAAFTTLYIASERNAFLSLAKELRSRARTIDRTLEEVLKDERRQLEKGEEKEVTSS